MVGSIRLTSNPILPEKCIFGVSFADKRWINKILMSLTHVTRYPVTEKLKI